MASQVLSGSGNVSYTNTTGENVRIIINYMSGSQRREVPDGEDITGISISFPGGSAGSIRALAIGKHLASVTTSSSVTVSSENAIMRWTSPSAGEDYRFTAPTDGTSFAIPLELMLAPGQSFSASCSSYNIVVIPEGG